MSQVPSALINDTFGIVSRSAKVRRALGAIVGANHRRGRVADLRILKVSLVLVLAVLDAILGVKAALLGVGNAGAPK